MKLSIKTATAAAPVLMVMCFLSVTSLAQNVKLTQYKMVPTFYNPANAGKFVGKIRTATLISTQRTDSASLNHALAYVDYKKEQPNGSTGMAISFYQNYDETFCLTGKFLSASIAKHVYLDADNYHMLSFGAQLTLASGHVDAAKPAYSKSISGGGFEMIGTPKTKSEGYKDFNAGFMYTYKDETIVVEAGLGGYHLLSPVNNLTSKPVKLPRRICFTLNTAITLDKDTELDLSTMMWKEGLSITQNSPTTIESIYSATIEKFINETSAFYVGLATRSLNTYAPLAGISLFDNTIKVTATYEQPFNKAVYNVRRGELSVTITL